MAETARILKFPVRRDTGLSPQAALIAAREFLDLPEEQRSLEIRERTLRNADVLTSLCLLLKQERDTNPGLVSREAASLYSWLKARADGVGLFDERDYFLGEVAYLAGSACRLLGAREEAVRWLDRSESCFRHTVNPAPSLSNVAYARLALSFDAGRYDDVAELSPSLRSGFERLGMMSEAAKCRLLEAMTLKIKEETASAIAVLEPVVRDRQVALSSSLRARIMAEAADLHHLEGREDVALTLYQGAWSLLKDEAPSVTRADLKMYVGSTYRDKGDFASALEALRSATEDYEALSMVTRVAYVRVFMADALLRLGREREAEWEILAALPTIEDQKMVPEGFAAMTLLKESVRRRKTDPLALRELREHLQGK